MSTETNTTENTSIQEIDFDFTTEYALSEAYELTERTFVNKKRNNPNLKKVTVLSQAGNVMAAEIESYPASDGETDGTPVTAEIMQEYQNVIGQADANARNSFKRAEEVAEKVSQYLTQSNENVLKLGAQIAAGTGTSVEEDGIFVASFNADKKLNVAISSGKAAEVFVAYDGETDTFTF